MRSLRSRRLLRVALAAAIAAPLAVLARGAMPPAPDRYVTDAVGVLDPGRAALLEQKLAQFERDTSNQVLVWIAPRVPEGTTAEEFGADAIRAWGVGQKGKDNGVVLFLFTEQRTTRIATGYGLEGAIPDVRAKRILRDVMRPLLASGDMTGGVEAGVAEVMSAARGEGLRGSGRTVAEARRMLGSPIGLAVVWILLAAFVITGLVRRSFLFGGAAGVLGLAGFVAWIVDRLPGELSAPLVIVSIACPVLVVFAEAARQERRDGPTRWSWGTRGPPWSSSGSSSRDGGSWSSSSSSSSSSGSGFSGGGGDSGGGGASDSY